MQQSAPGPLISATDFSELILENMVERIIAFDCNFKVLQVNQAFARWMGSSVDDAAGRSLFELLPELDTPARRAVLEQLWTGAAHFSNERYRSEEGFFEWRANPLRNHGGTIIGGLCLLRDITPVMKQFNEIGKLRTALHEKDVLLESRARIAEAILDHTHDYIAVLDTGLVYRAVNKAFLKYAGKTSEEMIGRQVLEVFPWLETSVFYTGMQEALTGKPVEYKNIPFSLSGGYANAYFIPLTFGDGLVYGVMLMTQDITELVQRRQEQEAAANAMRGQLQAVVRHRSALRSVFDASRDVILVFNREYIVQEANQRFMEYVGRSRDEVLGRSVYDIYGPGFRDSDIFQQLEQCWTGEVVVSDNYRFLQGEARGRVSLMPLHDEQGTITNVMVVAEDHTELLQKNEELARVNRELAERNQELDSVLYAASHDLRAPVRKIRYFLSALGALAPGSKTGPELLEKAGRAAERMESLVNSLADFQKNLPQESRSPTDLDTLLRTEATRLGLAGNIHWTSLPEIRAYPAQLRLLFEELFTNALKFRQPDRPLRVQVSAEEVPRGNGPSMLLLAVTDNGSGFDPACNDRVCDLFFRAHDAGFSGNGLGLPLCRKIMHAHQGSISVAGRKGEGTTVCLHFPCISVTAAG
ncbi:PAS domain S-box protein [Flaviaesturariibacter flavus]|uniref:histidine kinase n=1 Tax=Flaviaesturariibacter flavus TaxID=2502780 RepID=A0A4V2NVI0_9BACT|nr:PAS domain-containing protein [Flaviaesturariibacter flavus]TCJ13562.1 PAS domain S-box protein [Flaviaesturariibacter flavus]